MKKLKKYLFPFMLVASGLLIVGSGGGGGGCYVCDGSGKTDCIYCANEYDCTFCNGKGKNTCTFCNGTGK